MLPFLFALALTASADEPTPVEPQADAIPVEVVPADEPASAPEPDALPADEPALAVPADDPPPAALAAPSYEASAELLRAKKLTRTGTGLAIGGGGAIVIGGLMSAVGLLDAAFCSGDCDSARGGLIVGATVITLGAVMLPTGIIMATAGKRDQKKARLQFGALPQPGGAAVAVGAAF